MKRYLAHPKEKGEVEKKVSSSEKVPGPPKRKKGEVKKKVSHSARGSRAVQYARGREARAGEARGT